MSARWTDEQYKAYLAKNGKKEEKRPKYGNKKVEIDGLEFDSKKEGARYIELKLMQQTGQITELRMQHDFDISINGMHVCFYRADFTYRKGELFIVEDAKSAATRKKDVYRLKKKLMAAVLKIEIQEV